METQGEAQPRPLRCGYPAMVSSDLRTLCARRAVAGAGGAILQPQWGSQRSSHPTNSLALKAKRKPEL